MGFAETFKALSDPVRRDILTLLKEGSMSAGDIAAQFDMTAATISYHLKILKKSGLVCETKEKNYIYYSLNISGREPPQILLYFFPRFCYNHAWYPHSIRSVARRIPGNSET